MIRENRFKPVAAIVATVFTLGAVTAVAFAPSSSSSVLADADTVLEALPLPIAAPESLDRFLQTESVRRGDSLSALLARLGALDVAFQRFVATDPVARKVLQLEAGRTVLAELDGNGRVMKFSYRLTRLEAGLSNPARGGKRVLISRTETGFKAREEAAELERSVASRVIEVRTTLAAAAEAGGVPDHVTRQLGDIFEASVDLRRNLKSGDRLRVMYETVREPGSFENAAAGRVLAAELVAGGRRHEAVWFERTIGGSRQAPRFGRGEYYTYEARSLKQTFLRNPLEEAQLMSGFTEARMHPVMRDWRAHKGVDFAAPLGTRVRSVGDGVVDFAGQQRGYGNVVMIKHNAQIMTVYAHLNDFVDGLKVGDRLSQGDVLGYVGRTGWATGPHLHYEFRINNEPTDPMAVALPSMEPLEPADLQRFNHVSGTLRADLQRFDELRVARFQ